MTAVVDEALNVFYYYYKGSLFRIKRLQPCMSRNCKETGRTIFKETQIFSFSLFLYLGMMM